MFSKESYNSIGEIWIQSKKKFIGNLNVTKKWIPIDK